MLKILAVDFDNTLFHLDRYPAGLRVRIGNRIIHALVRKYKKKGFYIIVNTCRHDEEIDRVETYLKYFEIPFDAINENHCEMNRKYGESRKIFCTRSLDDTQMGLTGFLLRKFC